MKTLTLISFLILNGCTSIPTLKYAEEITIKDNFYGDMCCAAEEKLSEPNSYKVFCVTPVRQTFKFTYTKDRVVTKTCKQE